MKEKKTQKAPKETDNPRARFKVGDRVRVMDMPTYLHSHAELRARCRRHDRRLHIQRPDSRGWSLEPDGPLNNSTSSGSVRRFSGRNTRSNKIRCSTESPDGWLEPVGN